MSVVKAKDAWGLQSFCCDFLGFCPIIRGDKGELRDLLDQSGNSNLRDYALDNIEAVLKAGKPVVLVNTSYVDVVDGECQLIGEYRWCEVPEDFFED